MPLQNTCIYIIHTLWGLPSSLFGLIGQQSISAHGVGPLPACIQGPGRSNLLVLLRHDKKNRLTLITRVFCLVCCYLALLKGHHAHSALSKLDTQFYPDEPDFREYKILCSHVKFLISMEKEIVSWGLKFNLALLPGLWTCGRTVEAEEFLDQCSKSADLKKHANRYPGMESKYQSVKALGDLAKADLSMRVYNTLHYAHLAPAGCVPMSVLMSSMEEIVLQLHGSKP
ncbi:hypothetical protein PSTT_00091 [Puccinia striiformis]|uniref:Uncharacterized protein n=1 Tax=Puccinia striiformis TaxID=27350 RepID=A0A2S4W8A6_9BASI|nr:hypothetical protein PSTT_00091 [Puccinia striiformis]